MPPQLQLQNDALPGQSSDNKRAHRSVQSANYTLIIIHSCAPGVHAHVTCGARWPVAHCSHQAAIPGATDPTIACPFLTILARGNGTATPPLTPERSLLSITIARQSRYPRYATESWKETVRPSPSLVPRTKLAGGAWSATVAVQVALHNGERVWTSWWTQQVG